MKKIYLLFVIMMSLIVSLDAANELENGCSGFDVAGIRGDFDTTIRVAVCNYDLPFYFESSAIFYSGTYPFHHTTSLGFDSTVTLVVNVIQPSTIQIISNDTAFCAGDSLVLRTHTQSRMSCVWNTGDSTNSITVHSQGEYIVTAYDNYHCSSTDSIFVYRRALPQFSLSNDTTVCIGDSALLAIIIFDDDTLTHYVWNNGSADSATYVPSPGVYYVTATNQWNCSTVDSVTLLNYVFPDTLIIGNNRFCSGDSLVLSSVEADAYLWSTEDTVSSIVVNTEGLYFLTVTSATGCTATDSIYITRDTVPTVTIVGNDHFCFGDSITMNAFGADQYVWNTGDSLSGIVINEGGLYFVQGIDNNGCYSVDSQRVIRHQLPEILVSGDTDFCKFQLTVMSAAGGESYYWSTGDEGNSAVIDEEGAYWVMGTDSNGCSNTESFSITENALPVVSINGILSFCSESSTQLYATGAPAYRWNNGVTTDTVTVMTAGIYSIEGTDENGCVGRDTVQVIENRLPVVIIYGDTSFCTGDSTRLYAAGGIHYTWSTGEESASIIIKNAGLYVVTVTNESGCSSSKTVFVNENSLPVVGITGDNYFCENSYTTLTATGGNSYVWSNGSYADHIEVNEIGTYSVTAFNPEGCANHSAVSVVTVALPEMTISGEREICKGNHSVLSVTGGETYTWNTGEHGSVVSLAPTQTTVYTVTASNHGTCVSIDTVTLVVNDLPLPYISGNNVICQGATTTFTAHNAQAYQWSTGAVTTAISAGDAGVYSVTASSNKGCTATAAITLTVNELPVISINGRKNICLGNSTTLTAVGTGSNTFNWSSGETSATINTSIFGEYTVTGTNQNGCTATQSATIALNPMPQPVIEGNLSFCEGTTTTLTATGGRTYQWNDGSTSNSITVSSVGNYTVTVTNEYNCTASLSKTISSNPLPNATISGSTTLCEGSSTNLSVNGGVSYEWSTGETGALISVNTTGTYTVTVTNRNGCVAETSSNVIVNALPVITILGVQNLCIGNSTTLIASPTNSFNYVWTNGQTGPFNQVTPTTTTTYTVLVTDNNNCSSTQSVTVQVNKLPVANIIGTRSFCSGDTTVLSAVGGSAYLWSTGEQTNSINVWNADDYSVTVTNAAGCSASTTTSIAEWERPLVLISGNNTLCQGEQTLLTASGGDRYKWSTGSNNSSIYVTSSETYSVTATKTNGCTSSVSADVTVNPLPVISITGNHEICSGESTLLAASGEYLRQYQWSNGSTESSITVSATGNYTVTASNPTGCTNSATVSLTVFDNPIATIAGNMTVCPGASTTLTAMGGNRFIWSTGDTSKNITVSPLSNQEYGVTVSNENGCTATASATVTLRAVPAVSIDGDRLFCHGENTTLTASGNYVFKWSNESIHNSIVISAPGNYTVTATNIEGCSATASTEVTEYALPVVVIDGNNSCCENDSILLTAIGNNIVSYTWNNQQTGESIYAHTPGTYSVSVVDEHQCSSVASKTVEVHSLPVAMITGSLAVCPGASTVLTATGGTHFLWSDGSVTNSITVSPLSNQEYGVTVTNDNGCTATASATVSIHSVPTVSIDGSRAFCHGENTTLTASGNYIFRWSDGSIHNNVIVSTPGNYTVTATNIEGCSAIASTEVVEYALPVVTINGNNSCCDNDSILLTATGNNIISYTWNNQQTGESIYAHTSGTFSVSVVDEHQCASSALKTVEVHALPVASITGRQTVCPQDTAILVAHGGTHYRWLSDNVLSDTLSVSPLTSSSYRVLVTNEYGCSSIALFDISVSPVPIFVINGDAALCEGNTTILSASGNYDYRWSNDSTSSSITVGEGGIYSVTATNEYGCKSFSSKGVVLHSVPSLSITGNNVICAGDTTLLTVYGNDVVMYRWNTGDTNATIRVSQSGMYNVIGTTENHCSASTSVNVIVNPLPVAGITPSSLAVCPGDSTLLIAHGGEHYQWDYYGTHDTITVFPPHSDSYSVSVTNQYGCSSSTAVFITVHSSPTVNITGMESFCNGKSSILAATDGYQYRWSNDSTSSSIVVYSTGLYTVTAANAYGCTTTAYKNIIVYPTPLITIEGNDNICQGKTTTLRAVGNDIIRYHWNNADDTISRITVQTQGDYSVTVTNENGCTATATKHVTVNSNPVASITGTLAICPGSGTALSGHGGTRYKWSQGDTLSTISVFPAATTNYVVTVSNASGCTATTSAVVSINPAPSVSISGERSFCVGNSTTLTAVGGASYVWSTDSTEASIIVRVGGTYRVTASNSFGCTGSLSVLITENALPSPEIIGPSVVCAGTDNMLTATDGVYYQWYNSSTNPSITIHPYVTADYSVTVTNDKGCTKSVSKTVTVNPTPTASIIGNTTICQGDTAFLTALGGTSFRWNVGDSTAVFPATREGEYSVVVSNVYGCTASTSSMVTINPVPNPFITGSSTICENSVSTLTAGGGLYYLWSTNQPSATIEISEGGHYSVTATNTYGCTATDTFFVSTLDAPEVILTGDENTCFGNTVVINAAAIDVISYSWSNGSSSTSIQVHPETETTYSVTVFNNNGCAGSDELTVHVHPLYSVPLSDHICQGRTYNLHGFSLPAQNEPGVHVYELHHSTVFGCDSAIVLTLTVDPIPVITTPIIGNQNLNSTGNQTYYIELVDNADSYEWTLPDNPYWILNQTGTNTLNLSVTTSGVGTLNVIALNECGLSSPQTLLISCTDGIEDYEAAGAVELFPNPADNYVVVSIQDPSINAKQVGLFDINGKKVMSASLNDSTTTLDISSFSPGNYIVGIYDANNRMITYKKLIIK